MHVVSLQSEDDSPASTAVVHAVANATGRRPVDLPPLYESLDPDALDALVTSRQGNGRRDHDAFELRFRYAGVDVRVGTDGAVEVDRREV